MTRNHTKLHRYNNVLLLKQAKTTSKGRVPNTEKKIPTTF